MFVETKEAGEVAEAPARIGKFSQAIRVGSLIRPQCLGYWATDGGSCAVMAAGEATGYPYAGRGDQLIIHVMNRFNVDFNFVHSVWSKHDETKSREAVADWLEAKGY